MPICGKVKRGVNKKPPLRLKCVMAKNTAGKTTYISYRKWLDQYEEGQAPTNQPRHYYLESALSKAEWRAAR